MPYYTYIITNESKKSLYVGMSGNLKVRMRYHRECVGTRKSWAGRHHCQFLIYFEVFAWVWDSIDREKQLKRWSRKKKEWLIAKKNPDWDFLDPP